MVGSRLHNGSLRFYVRLYFVLGFQISVNKFVCYVHRGLQLMQGLVVSVWVCLWLWLASDGVWRKYIDSVSYDWVSSHFIWCLLFCCQEGSPPLEDVFNLILARMPYITLPVEALFLTRGGFGHIVTIGKVSVRFDTKFCFYFPS